MAEEGSLIMDVAVQGLDTLALASEDGSVTVKQLAVSQPGDSFVYNDVSNQTITSENRIMVHYSQNSIKQVIYVGLNKEDYCAVSGPTIYSGRSDAEVTL